MTRPRLILFNYRLHRAFGNRRWVALLKTAYQAFTHRQVYVNDKGWRLWR